MIDQKVSNFIAGVTANMPKDWVKLTTHRLDIYNESLAKTEFLDQFEQLFESNDFSEKSLAELPTAFDYIRLGHPLSCVLEWTVAKMHNVPSDSVISFSSRVTPILAVLRKNYFERKKTLIAYRNSLPEHFDIAVVQRVYGYAFESKKVASSSEIGSFDGSIVYISEEQNVCEFSNLSNADFHINTHKDLGSIILINGEENRKYISEIQHVRRRETIAMTPDNTRIALNNLIGVADQEPTLSAYNENKAAVVSSIRTITTSPTDAVIGSSGLSMQYAIVMGLIHEALDQHPGKNIKIIVPPNCYGGTNDQARRVAACNELVEVMDLPVDGDHNMVQSIDSVLEKIAREDAVPYIIAEIPTNPRVEVPDMDELQKASGKTRHTSAGKEAIAPVFILDQTFCPNVHFLGDSDILSSIQTIAYVSGSKFPSGGLCTAGYCVANKKAAHLMEKISFHLRLCDNGATAFQMAYLAQQLPSMLDRISGAYKNTRDFVNFIEQTLPTAKINFVSEELAAQGFTPSVFSLICRQKVKQKKKEKHTNEH